MAHAEGADGDAAFEVTFECSNCGDEWGERFPARTKVDRATGQQSVISRNKDCAEIGLRNCDCCERVVCPTCELHKPVRVADRAPIDSGGGEEGESDA